MTPKPALAAAAVAVAAAFTAPLATPAAAAALFAQPPQLGGVDVVANGTLFQAPLLAETFSFSGSADELAWWGTAGTDFAVRVYAAADPTVPLRSLTPGFSGLAAAGATTIDLVRTEVFRYSVPLGGLPGGDYVVSITETEADNRLASWYWLQSASGDARSVAGFNEPDAADNAFDLSLEVIGVVPEPGTVALMLGGLCFTAAAARRARRG